MRLKVSRPFLFLQELETAMTPKAHRLALANKNRRA
jgi:hypothetical protein